MNINVNNINLSDEQIIPIVENPKISMIIAGAGSGKTLTIVGKIKYMLDNNLINKEDILVITYTNKAVDSLKYKIKEAANIDIDVYTFHKLSLNIINKSNIKYSIVNDNLLDYIIDEFFYSYAFGNKVLLNYIFNIFNIYIFKTKYNYKKILKSKEYISFKKTIISFINYMKANNLFYKLKEILNSNKHKKELLIIYFIYNIYINELDSSNLLDFDKMIELATNLITSNTVKLPYRLVIVDEFQDTSLLRFNLIKSIVSKNNSKLCVVGDDYQSIYRFQGCDLSLFINFKKEFNDTKLYYLNETYRNSQELIDIAGSFIMKNPYQIKKRLVSNIHLNNPIRIIKYNNKNNVLINLIKTLPLDKEILILGRNNFDINKYIKDYRLLDNNLYIPNINHKLKYMTIHSSKGLESDIVIILNLTNDNYGIPSKLKENKLIELLKNKEEFPYSEERRLFYVALTRTKSYVYLLVDKYNPSIFIREIKN